MLKNYIKIAFRNIKKNKAYSLLNILGLATGMAAFVLIFLYVQHELSFDRHHDNADNIYRVVQHQPGNMYMGSEMFGVTAAPLAPALEQEFPEVIYATRFSRTRDALLSYSEKTLIVPTLHWTDPNTFKIFSIDLIKGNPETSLSDPTSILFSESLAKKYFGEEDPLGKTITYIEKHDFKVTGVFKDLPKNSHFIIEAMVPFNTLATIENRRMDQWSSNSFYTYFLLRGDADPDALEAKFPAFIDKYAGDDIWSHGDEKTTFSLQPLTKIHLHSQINFEISPNSDIRYIYLFSSIAFLILVIACINYMNLATARSAKRTREVGMRKVVGAQRKQLVGQFLGESMLLTSLALILAVILAIVLLPAFNRFIEREIPFNPLQNLGLCLGILAAVVFVGLAAGSYPALYISAFKPIFALRSKAFADSIGANLRNLLVVFQFSVSILLILSTVVVRNQLHYIKNRDMGFNRDHIVVLQIRDENFRKQMDAFKTELRTHPDIISLTTSSSLPNRVDSSTFAAWPGKPEDVRIPIYTSVADYDFLDVFEIKLAQGRNFSREHTSDSQGAFLINETALKTIGWDEPLGQQFGQQSHQSGNDRPAGRIVGVVKDFHMHSLHQEILPLYIFLRPNQGRYLSIRIKGEKIPETLAFIGEKMGTFSPKYPFEYSFFDDVFDQAYRAEQRIGSIFSTFSLLTIFIACLGLFGLSSFTAESRTREIGIRKVLGASSSKIVVLLSREYIKRVIVAYLIVLPLGYWAMNRWLENFAYRINLGILPFALAALLALAIASLTVSYHTLKASAANPADSLRYE